MRYQVLRLLLIRTCKLGITINGGGGGVGVCDEGILDGHNKINGRRVSLYLQGSCLHYSVKEMQSIHPALIIVYSSKNIFNEYILNKN